MYLAGAARVEGCMNAYYTVVLTKLKEFGLCALRVASPGRSDHFINNEIRIRV